MIPNKWLEQFIGYLDVRRIYHDLMAEQPGHELLGLAMVRDDGIHLSEKFSVRYKLIIPGSEILDWADDMKRVIEGGPANSSIGVRMISGGQFVFA